ncbi:DOMON domain-containing protein frrs1L [Polyrhizophydium stewartii]|uniref:DOMON domain-containing protein frrs1L n=1 Tax=Polyrhizophydium stewartii TaxID=2732419 RepID=A0ABR4MVI4_9FUNG
MPAARSALPALALAALPPAAAQAPRCFSLASSTACAEFADYTIMPDVATASNAARFTDLASFDKYVLATTGTTAAFQSFFRSRYSCPTWDGSGLRYTQSFFCGYLIQTSLTAGCKASTASAKQLCRTTAESTVASYNSVFASTKFCTAGVAHTLDASLTSFPGSLPAVAAPACIVATKSELSMCGLLLGRRHGVRRLLHRRGREAGNVSGPAPTSAAPAAATSSAPAASEAVAPPVATQPSGNKSQASSASSDSATTLKPILFIAVIAGGAIILVAVIAIFIVRGRKKRTITAKPVAAPKDTVVPMENVQIAETMQVVYDYTPNLFDELELHVGDNVIVKCKFDDGWAFGFNMSTKQEGSFPLACVAPLTTQRDTLPPLPPDAMAERIRQRASSLYVPPDNGQPNPYSQFAQYQ